MISQQYRFSIGTILLLVGLLSHPEYKSTLRAPFSLEKLRVTYELLVDLIYISILNVVYIPILTNNICRLLVCIFILTTIICRLQVCMPKLTTASYRASGRHSRRLIGSYRSPYWDIFHECKKFRLFRKSSIKQLNDGKGHSMSYTSGRYSILQSQPNVRTYLFRTIQ